MICIKKVDNLSFYKST